MIELIKRKLHVIFKSAFSKNVALLMTGTAISQVIGVLFYPVITRFFSPEDFGLYVLFNSILGILTVIGAMRYEFSIPIVANKFKAINALFMSLIILVVFCLTLLIITYLFGHNLLSIVDAEKLAPYKYILILGVFFAGLYTILNQWAFRIKAFKKLSVTRVSRSLTLNISQVMFGFFKFGGIGLITGKIIGEFSGNIVLIKEVLKFEKNIFSQFSAKEIKHLLIRYKKFPLFTAPTQLFNKAGMELPVFFITAIFGSSVVGLYGLAHLIVSLPMNLIGNAVGDVFYAEAASSGRQNPKDLLLRSNNLLKKLILMGIMPLVILLLFGPYLFGFVFGQEWSESGIYAQIIAILVFFRFIFTPISRIFQVFEKQIQALLLDMSRLGLVIIIFLIVEFYNINSYTAIGIYTAFMSLLYFITYICARRIIVEQIKSKQKENENRLP
ncbi:MAG: oligosaccharide flippase family protein [Brumimicrobium sp.]